MIVFTLPMDIERRPVYERLRIYASQIAAREGGLRLIALLEEAADELDLQTRGQEALS
jgi:hypothetical protein